MITLITPTMIHLTGGVGGIPIGDGSGPGSGGGQNNDAGQGSANKVVYTKDVRTLTVYKIKIQEQELILVIEKSILPTTSYY